MAAKTPKAAFDSRDPPVLGRHTQSCVLCSLSNISEPALKETHRLTTLYSVGLGAAAFLWVLRLLFLHRAFLAIGQWRY